MRKNSSANIKVRSMLSESEIERKLLEIYNYKDNTVLSPRLNMSAESFFETVKYYVMGDLSLEAAQRKFVDLYGLESKTAKIMLVTTKIVVENNLSNLGKAGVDVYLAGFFVEEENKEMREECRKLAIECISEDTQSTEEKAETILKQAENIYQIEKIPTQTLNHMKQVISEYQGYNNPEKALPNAMAAILEVELKNSDYQEFAIDNLDLVVKILKEKSPDYLAVKKDIKGKFYFQVDDEKFIKNYSIK